MTRAAADHAPPEGQAAKAAKPANFPYTPDPDDLAERVAIAQSDAGVPQDWCEGWARLQLMAPLPGFTPQRWSAFVDACGMLLDRHGRDLHRLGWTERELFGLDPRAPAERIDTAGLAFLMAHGPGDTIVDCGPDALTIQTATGARQRFSRRPPGTKGPPAWAPCPSLS